MSNTKQRVVILGASNKPDRYAYSALKSLLRHGHEVLPVNPALESIEGIPVLKQLQEVTGVVDTITLYVGSSRLELLIEDIIALKPRRIIANPGAESDALMIRSADEGIEYVEACTLVMLSTGQF